MKTTTSLLSLLLAVSTSAYPGWSLNHGARRLQLQPLPSPNPGNPDTPFRPFENFVQHKVSLQPKKQHPLVTLGYRPRPQRASFNRPQTHTFDPSKPQIILSSSQHLEGQHWITGTIHMGSPISPLTPSTTTIPLDFFIARERCTLLDNGEHNTSCLITDLANGFINDLPSGLALSDDETDPVSVVEDIWELIQGRRVHESAEVKLWGKGRLDAREWLDLIGLLRGAVLQVSKSVVDEGWVGKEGKRDARIEGVVGGVRVSAQWRSRVVDREKGRWVGCGE